MKTNKKIKEQGPTFIPCYDCTHYFSGLCCSCTNNQGLIKYYEKEVRRLEKAYNKLEKAYDDLRG